MSLGILVPDRDHDGIPDVSDNCPDIANVDQGNEDGDQFGDVCDPCPQIADNAPADTDGDHIGDACDPNPGMHDTMWLFEGFHSGLPMWAGSNNWAPLGDKIRVTASGNSGDNNEYLVLPLTVAGRTSFDNFAVTASVVVQQTMGGDNFHAIGISIEDDTSGHDMDCDIALDDSPSRRYVLLEDDINTSSGLDQEPQFAWAISAEYTITLLRRGSLYTCTVVGPGGMKQTTSGNTPVVPQTGAAVEVWAFGVIAEIDSVQVIGTP